MDIDFALAFARSQHNGVLLTIKEDGRPQSSNVFYAVCADDAIRVSITADRAKYHNLARDPRASLHISAEDFWSYVVLEGDADLTPVAADPHDRTVEDLVHLYMEFGEEHPDWDEYRRSMVAERRVVLTIFPTKTYGLAR